MTATIRQAVCKAVVSKLEGDRFTIDEVAAKVVADNPKLVKHEADRLITSALKGLIKAVLREAMDEEEQEALPGLRLPTAIVVRNAEGDLYYISSTKATWGELIAGYTERQSNSTRVQAKLVAYLEVMHRLKPYMQDDPTLTVADALRMELDDAA